MSEGDLKQRLAAILSADAVGYSRLMAADEQGTVASLDAARAVFRSRIESQRGRVVDMAGDSVLAVFDAATAAVAAALAAQAELESAAAALPESRRMWFRIGVHLGDLSEKADGSVYGDGVNIAARLQALAPPGGVTVSAAVRDAVRGRAEAVFADLGEQEIKNIAQPVCVFSCSSAAKTRQAAAAPAPGGNPDRRSSIAVLAFDNMSGDPEQEYFCDGISEDIITDLSKINGLAVIGRQSAFAYKGRATDLRRVGRELSVRYVLEGSVRKIGNRVRVTAQLIEAESGTHLWANRYDRQLDDLFLVGDEIAEDIVTSLDIKLGRGEDARVWRKALKSPAARDAFNRGWAAYALSTPQDNRRARELYLEAASIEPDAALPYAGAATTHCLDVIHGWSQDPLISLEQAQRLGAQAIALDDATPGGHFADGLAKLFLGRHQDAIDAGMRAVERRPMCASPLAGLAYMQMYGGQWESAIRNARNAIDLNPIYPAWYLYLMAAAQHFGGRDDEALATLVQVLAANPRLVFARALRIATLHALGRTEEAKVEARALLQHRPDFSVERFGATQPFRDQAQRDRYRDALRAAGLR